MEFVILSHLKCYNLHEQFKSKGVKHLTQTLIKDPEDPEFGSEQIFANFIHIFANFILLLLHCSCTTVLRLEQTLLRGSIRSQTL